MITEQWLVLTSASLTLFVTLGFHMAFGNLFSDIMDTFDASRSEVGSVQSILVASGLCSGIMNGILTEKFGPLRVCLVGSTVVAIGTLLTFFATKISLVIVFLSIISAIGVNSQVISVSASVGQHFTGKFSAVAVSIPQVASAVGAALYPFLLRYLADTYGFHGTVLIIGGLFLNTIPLALLLQSPTKSVQRLNKQKSSIQNSSLKLQISGGPQHNHAFEMDFTDHDSESTAASQRESQQINKDINGCEKEETFETNCKIKETLTSTTICTNKETKVQKSNVEDKNTNGFFSNFSKVIRNISYVLYVIGAAIAIQAQLTLIVYIQDIILDAGYTKNDASLTLFLLNLFGIFGRIIVGFLYEIKFMATFSVPILAGVLTLVPFPGTFFLQQLVLKMLCVCLVGFSFGLFGSLLPVFAYKYFDTNSFPVAMGVATCATGIILAAGGPFSGYIRDVTGSYLSSLLLASGEAFLATVLLLIGHFYRQHIEKETASGSSG